MSSDRARPIDAEHWLAMPYQIRRQVEQWQHDAAVARWLVVDSVSQYTGEQVYAMTITDPTVLRADKRTDLGEVARPVPGPHSFPYFYDEQTTSWLRGCWVPASGVSPAHGRDSE